MRIYVFTYRALAQPVERLDLERRPRSGSGRRTSSSAWARLAAVGLAAVLAGGCAAPVAVRQLTPREAERAQRSFALTSGKPSDFSQIVLRQHDLLQRFPKDPVATLADLHKATVDDGMRPDDLFALAELSFVHADRGGGRSYYLAAAFYAYALLFPEDEGPKLSVIDPRSRMAVDIYGRALAQAFAHGRHRSLRLSAGRYALPFGHIDIAFDPASLVIEKGRFTDLRPASDMEIKGLINRYRKAGVGTAVVAHVDAPKGSLVERYTTRQLRVPGTVLLEIDNPREALHSSDPAATLAFYPFSTDEAVTLDGRSVPLESEPSVALAMTLAESRFWKQEMSNFLGRTLSLSSASKLEMTEPYHPGRIPVVFVHGTNSSPARWADMINDLNADSRIHERFWFWAFSYMSSRPIALSAADLRRQLTETIRTFDPDGRDPCLQDMVVIGHSQGGLLTKMTAIDSGDRFWRNLSDDPFESVRMSEQTRSVVREALFVKPLPFVHRVIFVATPHRGSFLAGPQIIRRLIARLVTLPIDVVKAGAELGAATVGRRSAENAASLEQIPTSIDNMSPGNTFIRTLSQIPISPGIKVNSIIPVKTDGPVEKGNDGVVKYESAHIDGVESELIVKSAHSVQSNPHAIDEVRRILLEHLAESSCEAPGSKAPILPPPPPG